MELYADIIINKSAAALDRSFQYRIPADLADSIRLGSRVEILFNRRPTAGYVVGLGREPQLDREKILPISGLSPRGVEVEDRLMELAFWMRGRYGCTLNQALMTVLPVKKTSRKGKDRGESLLLKDLPRQDPLPLNPEQQRASEAVLEELSGERRPVLLFGITGSGKTEVYMDLVEKMKARERQVILLIPEISLTYQNLRRFYQRFGDRIGLIHSRQSQGEKSETLARAARGELDLVIGPRSALFVPLPRLGLIIIDEEHDGSYHSEQSPRYHSVEVAAKYGELTGAGLLLGSATPSLESYYRADKGLYRLIKLSRRAVPDSLLPAIRVVDLREELRGGNKSIFSGLLKEKIQERLEKKEQIMLFLNRRGYAGFVSCRSCGKVFRCPHCDVSLTFHRGGGLKCHFCGFELPYPQSCPDCGSPYVAAFGSGTQKVESIIQKEFPGARVLRMDADTTRGKEGHSKLLSVFSHQGADILVGTQMIVKGHDFPRVSLVGILAADLSLYHADHRAAEETFSLLTQAAGRAGRSQLAGEVVIQSYTPEHYAIQWAARQDYEGFFREEITRRELLRYPPVWGLLTIMVSGTEEGENAAFSQQLAAQIREAWGEESPDILGPTPHFRSKIQDIFRQMIYIKSPRRDRLLQIQQLARQRGGSRIQTDIY